jgi:hypothetical protein
MPKKVRKIRNWDQFQHWKSGKYAKSPPWIKLYPQLLNDPEWHDLGDRDKAILVDLWMLASERGGTLPNLKTICFRLRRSEKEILSVLDRMPNWLDTDCVYDVCTDCALEKNIEKNIDKDKDTDTEPSHEVVREAFDFYNEVAKELSLPIANQLTQQRWKKLHYRLKQSGLQGWKETLTSMKTQPFLLGQGSRGWRADLDFLLQASSFQRVAEGAYSGGPGPPVESRTQQAAARLMEEIHAKRGNGGFGGRGIGGNGSTGELSEPASRSRLLSAPSDDGPSQQAKRTVVEDDSR